MSRHGRVVTVLDQIVSSASNFILVVLVAHVSSAALFGEFSLAYVLVIFFLGLGRALVGEVMLVRESTGRTTRDFDGAVGLAVVVGVVGGLVLLAGAALHVGRPGLWLVLAAALPMVLLQDVLRYVLICCRLSGRALGLDLVWLLTGTGGMLAAVVMDAGALLVVVAWCVGGAASVALGLVLSRTVPRVVTGLRWLVENRALSARFAAEFTALNGSNALVWFVLTGPLGAVGVAGLRGASLLFSPLNTGFNAVRVAMIPELVRTSGTPAYRRSLSWVAGALLLPCLVWGGVVLLLPSVAGSLLLGQTWNQAEELRLPYFAQALAMVGYTVLLSYFRSSGLHGASSRMRGVLAGGTLVMPPLLGWLTGPAGSAWGFAGAVTLSAAVGVLLSRPEPRGSFVQGAA